MKINTLIFLNDRNISFIKKVWLVLCVLLVLVGIPFPQTTAMAASGTYQYTSATNPVSAAGATTDDGVYRYITDIDLEGDGDRDFIGYLYTTNDGVYNGSYDFFVNNGSGTFSRVEPAGITLPLTNGSSYLCTDFDNDGDDDIFAANPDAPGFGAYYTNNGSGIFTSAANPLAAAGALTDNGDIFIIDIDLEGDGDRDFIAYYNAAGYHDELNNNIYNGSYDFFVNNGIGSFSRVEPAGITLPLQTGDNYICADFDNDGDEDIYAPGGYFTNDGTGNFTSATNPISAAGATTDDGANRYIADIDLDSDGDIDFIAYDGSIYAFYMNNGSGSFTKDVPTVELPLNNANEYLCTDFDNDGDEDIFAPGGYFIQGGTSAGTNNRPPRKSATSPADNATGVSQTENISISFDETITNGGSGRINIYQSAGDALVESIPGNDARVSGFGTSTITINPNATFSGNTQYYVTVEAGALFDDDGMTFAGIDTNTEFNFEAGITDSTAPTVDINTGLTLNEGATAYLASGELDSSDDTAGASDITYTVTSGPSNGSLSHSTFTQVQLDLGNVVSYTHNDSNTTSDNFSFRVSDSSGNEVAGQTFNITVNAVDDDPPTVNIISAHSSPTNSFPLTVTITFDEDVSGFVQGDIAVGNGNASNFTNTVANRVWTADITPLGEGPVTVDVNSGVCTDAAGNGNTAAAQFSIDYDGTAPSTWITSSEGDPTNNSPFSVTITFDEDVSGFVIGDITVGNGNASNFTNTVANRVWTADITPLGDGTVTVDVNSGVCTDAAGNGNTAAAQFSIDYDGTAPSTWITSSEGDPTNNSPFPVTITFNKDVSGFVIGDITVGNGNASNFTNTTANRVWTADITPSGDGAVTVDINAGVCVDAAGNGNDAALQFSVDYDGTSPTVAITSGESDPTNNAPFSVTVTFNEDVSGFVIGDITVGNGSASNFTNTTLSRVWTADITPSGDGTVTVDVNAGVCTDAAGNGNYAASQFSVDYDGTSPTATITSTESDPTNSSAIPITITFDEDISGFVLGDITIGNGNASNFTNTVANRVWTTDITPSGDGAVTVDINAGVCTDAAGNGNDAASQLSLDYDGTAPTVVVNTGLIVNEGAVETITITQLSATDTEAHDALLIYTVTDLPDNGYLSSNGSTLLLNGTFTQQDIIDGKMRYIHNGSETTLDSFVFKVADNAENELMGKTFNITVIPINDDPAIPILPTDITVVEDTASNVDLSAAVIKDADSGAGCITLNITASAGTLSASSGGEVTISGSDTSTLTLYGMVANINSYLDTASNIRYTGAANAYGNDAATLTLTANDGGNTGTGGGTNVNLGTINVDITAVNDDPTITGLPTDITFTEDTSGNVDLSAATIGDADSDSASITLSMMASAGTLSASSCGGVTVSGSGTSTLTLSGTAANIDSYLNTVSNIRYTGAANSYGNDAATLTLTANDGGNTGMGGGAYVNLGTVNIDIVAVNDVPTLVVNTGISLNEGATAAITSTQLSATDVETADGLLTYTVTTGSVNGQLENTDNPSVSISGFTQQNIMDGKIQYVHDGSNTTSGSFTFKVSDSEGGELTGQMFSITVNAIDDDAPTMVNNKGLTLDEGAVETIATAELLATDTETADASIVYMVMDLPDNGELSRDGSALALNGTFTQQDIIDGKIKYTHDGSTTESDSFDFKVADSNANELCGQTFSITINLAPVPTITPSPTQMPGEDTRTIRGTLLDEHGNPKVGYVVELHSTPITAITDSQGRYRFDNVDYTAHTLFIKTPEGQQITSFALSFDVGEEFEKSVTGEGADITYTKSTVSVDITIALDGDEDGAAITGLSGVDNPATGSTNTWWMLILAAIFAAGLIGLIFKKKVSARS